MFRFKQFTIHQDRSAMKVTTDSCLFGAWVANYLSQEITDDKTILDVGTGTGLLSLMFAQKSNLVIDAVEIDTGSFQQAEENIRSSEWSGRIQIFNEDIRLFQSERKYDYIVCNPPFYENELKSPDGAKNTAHHSTELRLEELLTLFKNLLHESGSFFLLLPYKREKEIDELFTRNGIFVEEKLLVKQSVNHSYFRILLKATFQKTEETKFCEILIRDNAGEYSDEFITLLKDYYLYL